MFLYEEYYVFLFYRFIVVKCYWLGNCYLLNYLDLGMVFDLIFVGLFIKLFGGILERKSF